MVQRQILRSGLITVLAGVSATAAFAATGFIVALGREQLLGFHLDEWTAQTLTLLAGRCAADSFLMLLDLIAAHPWITGIVLLGVGAGGVALRHLKLPEWARAAAPCLAGLALVAVLVHVLVTFEAPTVTMRGWLLPSDDKSRSIDLFTYAVRCQLFAGSQKQSPSQFPEGCTSQGNDSAVPGNSPVVAHLLQRRNYVAVDNPAVLLLETASPMVGERFKGLVSKAYSPQDARDLLNAKYEQAVGICLLSLIFVLFVKERFETQLWSEVRLVVRTAVLLFSGTATIMLPYVYGKIFDATLFPVAVVSFEQPPIDNAVKAQINNGEYPLLSRDDKKVDFLWIAQNQGATHIVEVPVERIHSLQIVSNFDAMQLIADCIVNASGNHGGDYCR